METEKKTRIELEEKEKKASEIQNRKYEAELREALKDKNKSIEIEWETYKKYELKEEERRLT